MHTISSFLHPPIFPLIPPPPPPPLLHLKVSLSSVSLPFLREKGEEIYSPFSLSFLFLLPSFLLSPSLPSFIPLFLPSFLPSSPSFKICESYPLAPPRFIVSYSLLFPFPFVYLSSVPPLPPSLLLHSRIRERIFTKHMENGEKLCTGLVWEEMMSIKD